MSEHDEARALMRVVGWHEARYPELKLLVHIPNGGYRFKATAGRLRETGVKPGVPDYFLAVPRSRWKGLWIELKTRHGRVSPEQRDWIVALRAQGYRAEVCKGWQAAWDVIKDYLGQSHDARSTPANPRNA